jgi:hypothetical protein
MDAAARVEFTTIIVSVRDPAAAHLLKEGKGWAALFRPNREISSRSLNHCASPLRHLLPERTFQQNRPRVAGHSSNRKKADRSDLARGQIWPGKSCTADTRFSALRGQCHRHSAKSLVGNFPRNAPTDASESASLAWKALRPRSQNKGATQNVLKLASGSGHKTFERSGFNNSCFLI